MRVVRTNEGARGLALSVFAFVLLAAGSGCHTLFVRPALGPNERIVRTEHFAIRTDLGEEATALLAASAEQMYAELEGLLPAPNSGAEASPREVIVFRQESDFKRFLRAHLFANPRAIGFFCELGGECALSWNEPPGPEDLRVLRHELAHQHLARRLASRLPTWFEEGFVERLALGPLQARRGPLEHEGGPSEQSPSVRSFSGLGCARWRAYLRERESADAVSAALAVHQGAAHWNDEALPQTPATDLPEPGWADEQRGYVLHLLFVRFLEACGEGMDGALGAMLRRALRGERPRLDLTDRFPTLADVQAAFEDFVLHEGLEALFAKRPRTAPERRLRRLALEALAAPSPAR